MTLKDDTLYLIHISEEIARIEHFTTGGKVEFLQSDLVQYAVLRSLQTLAESVKRLSDALKASHPEVPWKDIIGLRNVLVHDYLAVDVEEIWKIVELDLPRLKRQISLIRSQTGGR
jgi:uncharacterized protein with HEPN domain